MSTPQFTRQIFTDDHSQAGKRLRVCYVPEGFSFRQAIIIYIEFAMNSCYPCEIIEGSAVSLRMNYSNAPWDFFTSPIVAATAFAAALKDALDICERVKRLAQNGGGYESLRNLLLQLPAATETPAIESQRLLEN